jgi:hypothetical protein
MMSRVLLAPVIMIVIATAILTTVVFMGYITARKDARHRLLSLYIAARDLCYVEAGRYKSPTARKETMEECVKETLDWAHSMAKRYMKK